jgi:hypothetical protein
LTVLDDHEFVEFRQHPNGTERFGLVAGANMDASLIWPKVVAFRTWTEPWQACSAGSAHGVRPETWERWEIVEGDPLA